MTQANYWVLAYGLDCDGYNRGSVTPFDNMVAGRIYADECNHHSDGINYETTSNWNVVLQYCESYNLNPDNYKTTLEQ